MRLMAASSMLVRGSGGGRPGLRPPLTVTRRSVVAVVTREHGADRRIRIRADVLAVDEHVVGRVGAVFLGLRQGAGGGAEDHNESNEGLQHSSLLWLVATPASGVPPL